MNTEGSCSFLDEAKQADHCIVFQPVLFQLVFQRSRFKPRCSSASITVTSPCSSLLLAEPCGMSKPHVPGYCVGMLHTSPGVPPTPSSGFYQGLPCWPLASPGVCSPELWAGQAVNVTVARQSHVCHSTGGAQSPSAASMGFGSGSHGRSWGKLYF